MNIFYRLVSYFFPKNTSEDNSLIYSSEERKIYSYFDGSKTLRVDPLPLYKAIMSKGPEISVDMKVARNPTKGAKKAHDNMVLTIRKLFSLRILEENGLTELECLDILDHFLGYTEKHKKKFEEISDLVHGNIASYITLTHKKPTYQEFFGFWLNRNRVLYKQAYAIAFGYGVALGNIDPAMEYYLANTDSEEEAKVMKMQVEAARRMSSG